MNPAHGMDRKPPRDTRERAFDFACEIVKFCLKLRRVPGCQSVADQLLRSGTGLAANAEEAKAAYSRREFALKNSYALKEGREARFWLRLIIRCHLAAEEEQAQRLCDEAGELIGILAATVRSLRRTSIS